MPIKCFTTDYANGSKELAHCEMTAFGAAACRTGKNNRSSVCVKCHGIITSVENFIFSRNLANKRNNKLIRCVMISAYLKMLHFGNSGGSKYVLL